MRPNQIGPQRADRAAQQAAVNQRSRTGLGYRSFAEAPVSALYDLMIENNFLYTRNLAEYGL